VPPDNEIAFIEALKTLLNDQNSRDRMGVNGRVWVEQHASPGAVAAAYEAIYLNNR
jgi:glycosyltransferase involved in cell wall biosynthesis